MALCIRVRSVWEMYCVKYSWKTCLEKVWVQVYKENVVWTMYGFKYSLKTFLDNVWFQVFIEDVSGQCIVSSIH